MARLGIPTISALTALVSASRDAWPSGVDVLPPALHVLSSLARSVATPVWLAFPSPLAEYTGSPVDGSTSRRSMMTSAVSRSDETVTP